MRRICELITPQHKTSSLQKCVSLLQTSHGRPTLWQAYSMHFYFCSNCYLQAIKKGLLFLVSERITSEDSAPVFFSAISRQKKLRRLALSCKCYTCFIHCIFLFIRVGGENKKLKKLNRATTVTALLPFCSCEKQSSFSFMALFDLQKYFPFL